MVKNSDPWKNRIRKAKVFTPNALNVKNFIKFKISIIVIRIMVTFLSLIGLEIF